MMKTSEKCAEAQVILFNGKTHRDFYEEYLRKCRRTDVFHKALLYCLGIDKDTRDHIGQIYDLKKGCVETRCLRQGWQTGSSRKTIRLAFNLYCNGTPSVYDHENVKE